MIRSLDTNQTHGHHDIFIRMWIKCDLVIINPLSLIFSYCINHSMFSVYTRNQIYALFIKKWQIKNQSTIDQSLYCQCVKKYLKD